MQELDEALHLTDQAGDSLTDSRTGKNTRHNLAGLLHQSVYARLAGYEDVNGRENFIRDPETRAVVGKKVLDKNAASHNTVWRLETETLTSQDNIDALSRMNGAWVSEAMEHTDARKVILDLGLRGVQGPGQTGRKRLQRLLPLFLLPSTLHL